MDAFAVGTNTAGGFGTGAPAIWPRGVAPPRTAPFPKDKCCFPQRERMRALGLRFAAFFSGTRG
eukprot:1095325-Prymnesium_polylepis.1